MAALTKSSYVSKPAAWSSLSVMPGRVQRVRRNRNTQAVQPARRRARLPPGAGGEEEERAAARQLGAAHEAAPRWDAAYDLQRRLQRRLQPGLQRGQLVAQDGEEREGVVAGSLVDGEDLGAQAEPAQVLVQATD